MAKGENGMEGGAADIDGIIKGALAAGADQCEVLFASSSGYSLETMGSSLRNRQFGRSAGYGIRVLCGGKLGFSYFSGKGKARARAAIKSAISSSRHSQKTNFCFPTAKVYREVCCFDNKVFELGPEQAQRMILGMTSEITRLGSTPTECSISFGSELTRLSNSEGLNANERTTHISAYAQCARNDSVGYATQGSVSLDFSAESLGEEAATLAKRMEGAKPVSLRGDVILSKSALHSLLPSLLLPPLTATASGGGPLCWQGRWASE